MQHRALERLERLCTFAGLIGAVSWISLVPAAPARALTALSLAALWMASTMLVPLVFVSMAMRLSSAHENALRPVQGALATILLLGLALGAVHFPSGSISHENIDAAAILGAMGAAWARVLQSTKMGPARGDRR